MSRHNGANQRAKPRDANDTDNNAPVPGNSPSTGSRILELRGSASTKSGRKISENGSIAKANALLIASLSESDIESSISVLDIDLGLQWLTKPFASKMMTASEGPLGRLLPAS